jgi:CheY-like chemotaxis protein
MKILVCEDDQVVLKVIQVALEGEKAETIFVKDGRQALQQLNTKNDFDLIITDIHMPYNNGDEILRLVREEQKKKTPIIMISSDTEEEVIALALKSGVNEFIAKPLDADKLKKKIRKLLKL